MLSALPRLKFNLSRVIFYLVTFVALVLVYAKFSEFRLLLAIFEKANLWWLVGIALTQLLFYYFLTLNYRDVLRIKDLQVSIRELFPLVFVIQFLNQALPSATISGQAFFVMYLRKFGMPFAESMSRALLELMTLYIAIGAFFVASVSMLFASRGLFDHPELAYLIYVFLFFGIIFAGIFIALQRKKRSRFMKWMIFKLRKYFENGPNIEEIIQQMKETVGINKLKHHRLTFWSACLWQGLELLMNVFTLYFVFFAIGEPLSFTASFIVFTLTRFISMVSFIPGAFGIFEGSMTFVLATFGMPIGPALAATLLFRAFSFWLPLPVGWWLYRKYMHAFTDDKQNI